MITFNPGPSRLDAATTREIQEIAVSGILSASHRGKEVKDQLLEAVARTRQALAVPTDYQVLFQPSATAAMECVLRNLVHRESFHFVHGAFSRRFHTTAAQIGLQAQSLESPWEAAVPWPDAAIGPECELMAVTHTETSSGLSWPLNELTALRHAYPNPLLAVDATSAAGGVMLPWEEADVWFFSVQKCLGLPAGLGLLLVGPRALARAGEVADPACAWQNFSIMADKMQHGETVETPNVLAIALLAKRMARLDLVTTSQETKKKAEYLYTEVLPWQPFVEEPEWRSPTVGNFVVDEPQEWHVRAQAAGYVLGKGYGKLKGSCVRIANFPATAHTDLQGLIAALRPLPVNRAPHPRPARPTPSGKGSSPGDLRRK